MPGSNNERIEEEKSFSQRKSRKQEGKTITDNRPVCEIKGSARPCGLPEPHITTQVEVVDDVVAETVGAVGEAWQLDFLRVDLSANIRVARKRTLHQHVPVRIADGVEALVIVVVDDIVGTGGQLPANKAQKEIKECRVVASWKWNNRAVHDSQVGKVPNSQSRGHHRGGGVQAHAATRKGVVCINSLANDVEEGALWGEGEL